MGKITVEEYLDLFRAKADQMGEFPDKNIISALTGTAERNRADKAQAITTVLQNMLADPEHPAKRKLPICFLVDSIVKNISDPYADLFESGLPRWFCSAYDAVDDKSKRHLARVVATWEVQSVFSAEKRKEIQRYMLNSSTPAAAASTSSSPAPSSTSPPSSATVVTTVRPTLPAAPPIPVPPPPVPAVAAFPPPQATLAPVVAPVPAPAPAPLPPPPPLPLPPAPAQTVPVPGAPDIPAMINSRMKQLLDQQLLELGEPSTMSLDHLWRTNADLASQFRLVAQAQVHEQLGLPPPPPPPAIAITPVQQQQQPPTAVTIQQPPMQPVPHQQPQQQQQQQQQQAQPQPQQQPHPQTQLSVQLPLGTPPPWAAKPPPSQDFGRAVQVANELAAGARVALDASMRGDLSGAQVQAAEAAGKAAMLACLLGGDAAAAVGGLGGSGSGGGVGVYLADLDPLDVRSLARGNPAGVRRLYGEEFPFWCKQDGMRFRTQVQLDAHMDLLFRRKRARREQKGSASREWYCTAEEWVTDFGRLAPPAKAGARDGEVEGGVVGDGSEDGGLEEDADPDGSKSCVPADERFSKCRICGDRFLMFYDNDEEEWMYRNACYISVKGVEGEGESGMGDEDDEGEEDAGGGGEGEERGEMAGGAKQIIVHKLCLDVSGLRNKEEITWVDLMPGTPRQRKRPAESDDGLDASFFGKEDGDADEEERDDNRASLAPDDPPAGDEAEGRAAGGDGNGGVFPDEFGEDDGPPLKRVKAEQVDGQESGAGGYGAVDAANARGDSGAGAVEDGAGDMDEELDFEA